MAQSRRIGEEEGEGAPVDENGRRRAQSTLACLAQRRSWRCSGTLT